MKRENNENYNCIMTDYQTRVLSMLGVSPESANPAKVTAILKLTEDAQEGTLIKKGTRLCSDVDDGEPVVFETAQNIYATVSGLTDAFMVSGTTGTKVSIIDTQMSKEGSVIPFRLFDFTPQSVENMQLQHNTLKLYCGNILDLADSNIYIKFDCDKYSQELINDGIREGKFIIKCMTEKGMCLINRCSIENDSIKIIVNQDMVKYNAGDEVRYNNNLIEISAREDMDKGINLAGISLNSEGQFNVPEYMGDVYTEVDRNDIKPFGNGIFYNEEFYIGHKNYLNKTGAKITVRFKLDFEKCDKNTDEKSKKEKLKLIMRESKNSWINAGSKTWIDEVAFEYYNGSEWKNLRLDHDCDNIFADADKADEYTFSFRCPIDICDVNVGTYSGKAFRIRVNKPMDGIKLSDIQYYPKLNDVEIAYSYSDNWQKPEKVTVTSAIEVKDITGYLDNEERIEIFTKELYSEDSLYLGFDSKFEDGPISLFYDISDNMNLDRIRLKYEYSSSNGMKSLQVIDNTEMLSTSGTMLFMPPADFMAVEYEGKNKYWLRISSQNGFENRINSPLINNISLNAVEAIAVCSGERGNIKKGELNSALDIIKNLYSIHNPKAAYGGKDIESITDIVKRSGAIINGRRRLISQKDYERELKYFCSNIDKVSCITGTLKDGSEDADKLNIVVLMKDYKNGSYSFYREQPYLYEHLCDKCELAIAKEDINIVEPLFVKISVGVWLTIDDISEKPDIENSFEKCLTQFLEPVAEKEGDKGWKIGELPHENQIIMRLNALKTKASIQHISMTAIYRDAYGRHETDIDSLMKNPYVICCNGQHKIYVNK